MFSARWAGRVWARAGGSFVTVHTQRIDAMCSQHKASDEH